MKTLLLGFLMMTSFAMAGGRGEGGGSGSMGGGGLDEYETLRLAHAELNECEFYDFLVEDYDLEKNPPLRGSVFFAKVLRLKRLCD